MIETKYGPVHSHNLSKQQIEFVMDTYLESGPVEAARASEGRISQSGVRGIAKRLGISTAKKTRTTDRPVGRDYWLMRLEKHEREHDSYADAMHKFLLEYAPEAIAKDSMLQSNSALRTRNRITDGRKRAA